MPEPQAYGLWSLVILNSVLFIFFAFTFFKPRTGRDWRSFGAFSAFLVALFTEMYGFPLTLYFLSGWLQTRFPGVDWWSHDAGHLLETMFGWRANPHFGPFHILSFAFIGGGFWLISAAGALSRSAGRRIGRQRTLSVHPPSAIRRLRPGDVRLPVAVADGSHPGHVPGPGLHVLAAGKERGTRDRSPLRPGVRNLQAGHAGLHSAAALPGGPGAFPPLIFRSGPDLKAPYAHYRSAIGAACIRRALTTRPQDSFQLSPDGLASLTAPIRAAKDNPSEYRLQIFLI
jgi:hypothetical protein